MLEMRRKVLLNMHMLGESGGISAGTMHTLSCARIQLQTTSSYIKTERFKIGETVL